MPRIARAALTALLLAVALAAAAPASGAPWPRPLHYDATLTFVNRTHTLSGSERITFLNDTPKAANALWLRVWPNGYGSCRRRFAKVSVTEGGSTGRWAVGCSALRVRLAAPVASGAQGTIGLKLSVRAPHRSDRFGHAGGMTFLGNVLPLLAVGPKLPPYTDLGESFYSLDASWAMSLTVPRGLLAATTGVVQSQQGQTLSIVSDHARDVGFVIGPFKVESTTSKSGIRLNRFYRRADSRGRARALKTLATASKAVDRYVEWFGPPGESEVDMAPMPPRSGIGMEYPGMVMTPDLDFVFTHELAHQWWYSLVGDDQYSSPWLDESFAEFATRRLPRRLSGPDRLGCNPRKPFGRVRTQLDASMKHWERKPEDYGFVIYRSGTCVLRSLQHDLGVGWMTSFLRSYVDAHRFGVSTTHDFVAALRVAAPPAYDVDAFLRRAKIRGR